MLKRRSHLIFAGIAITLIGGLCIARVSARVAGPKKDKSQTTSVTIDNMKFSPDTVKISVGDTVEWSNNDVRDHTVVAKDGSFTSQNLSKGDTFPYTFKKPGKYPYSCSLHPRMKGTVVVSE